MDIEQKIYITKLYDVYYDLFSKRQQEIFEMYFDDDFSVTEISQKLKVSKPNVSKTLKTIITKLDELEAKLNVYKNYEYNINLLKSNKIENDIIKKIK